MSTKCPHQSPGKNVAVKNVQGILEPDGIEAAGELRSAMGAWEGRFRVGRASIELLALRYRGRGCPGM